VPSQRSLLPTMISMKNMEDGLREAGLVGKIKVVIDGPPTTEDSARTIGAYSKQVRYLGLESTIDPGQSR
jgi:methanogenic corrinoid protein MtbC1